MTVKRRQHPPSRAIRLSPAPLVIAATIAGRPVTLRSADVSGAEVRSDSSPSVPVCDLPGGSDMPGTVVRFDATLDEGEVVTDDVVLNGHGPGCGR